MFVSGGGNNQTGWSNKEYDHLIAEAGQTADHDKRMELFQQAEAILLEEAPMIPVFHYTHPYFLQPSVKDWAPNILDLRIYKYVHLDPPGAADPHQP